MGRTKGISYGDTTVTVTARNQTEVAMNDKNYVTLTAANATLAAETNRVVATK